MRFQSDELVALRGFVIEVARSLLPQDSGRVFADLEAEVAADCSLEGLRQAAQEWTELAQLAGLSVSEVERLDTTLGQRNLTTFSEMRAVRYQQLCHVLGRGTAESEAELRLANSFMLDINAPLPPTEKRNQLTRILGNATTTHFHAFVRSFVAENRQQRWIHLLVGGGRNLERDGSRLRRYLIDSYCQPMDSISALPPDTFGVYSDFRNLPVWLGIEEVWEGWRGNDGLFVFKKGQRAIYFHHSDGIVFCRRNAEQT